MKDKQKHMEESINKIHSILIKASKDEAFKKELKIHYEDILKKEGIDLYKNHDLNFLENTKEKFHFTIPAKKLPAELELKTLPKNASLYDIERWIITQIQGNTALKGPLLEDAGKVLRKHGIKFPKHLKAVIHQNSDKIHYLIIPRFSEEDELNELELQAIAGGTCWHHRFAQAPSPRNVVVWIPVPGHPGKYTASHKSIGIYDPSFEPMPEQPLP